ncbi:MAG: YcaO-like family protein [Flavobacteriaceae bacterium]|jgi:YcaO-like protein with predicted kinase domain|nr:YcaO-like family protein [Flavobacteriaceae bacterium]
MENNIRPYKENSPLHTIFRIQNILADINILTTAPYSGRPFSEIYSVRIEAIDEQGSFGTNGKGRTQLYCLASAYAEFVERVQNLMFTGLSGLNKLMLKKSLLETGFYYYPDEKLMTKEEFMVLPDKILSDFFPNKDKKRIQELSDIIYEQLNENNVEGLVSVPFFSIKENKVVYIPYNFLFTVTGSNGMASGNSISEASFQSLCEIYERNAGTTVYTERLTPPVIDLEFLEKFPEELNLLKEIQSKGFETKVLDFSCGKKFPVVGLLLIDRTKNKYRLNVGSDTNFKVALSRVITEIFQGSKDLDVINKSLLDFPSKETVPFLYENTPDDIEEREKNITKFMKDGSGIFPESLFGEVPSYDFDETAFKPKKSYEEEVKYLLNLANNLDYDVYMRDVSVLGFPAVFIYIPNISILGQKSFSNKDNINISKDLIVKIDELENLLIPFDKLIYDQTKINRAIEIIESLDLVSVNNEEYKLKNLFKLEFKKDSSWNNIPTSFFMILLTILAKDFKKSIHYLDLFINQMKLGNNLYYKEIKEYLTCLSNNKSVKHINKNIVENLSTPESLFKFIKYPNCPDCSNCELNKECNSFPNYDLFNKVKKKAKEVFINQNKFSIYA